MGQVFTLPDFVVSNLIACHPKRGDATGLFSSKLISARKPTQFLFVYSRNGKYH